MRYPTVSTVRLAWGLGLLLLMPLAQAQADALRITSVGDSLTSGYNYKSAGQPTKLEQKFLASAADATITKVSNGGLTSTQLVGLDINGHDSTYRNYVDEALASDPDVILFMLGTNDTFRNEAHFYNRYLQNIQGTFNQFKAFVNSRGNHPRVIVGVPTPILSDTPGDKYDEASGRLETLYNPWLRATVPAYGFQLLDLNLMIQQQTEWQDLYRDHVHFTGVGFDWIAQQFHDATVVAASAIPEPTAIVLMSMAAVCVGTLRRR